MVTSGHSGGDLKASSMIRAFQAHLVRWQAAATSARGHRLSRSAALGCALAVVLSFTVFALLAPSGFFNGDAAVYAEQILSSNLQIRTIHIGYYAMGIVFTRLLPLDTPLALNLMAALLGALSTGLVASVAYTISGRLSAAITSAAALMCMHVFVNNSVFAEIYIAQLFFFLLCVQFCLWDRPAIAGLSFACAFLVTPSTVLSVPFILLLRPQKRFILRWAFWAAVPPALVLLPRYRDFLWGPIGMLNLQPGDVTLGRALPKEAREAGGLSIVLLSLFSITGLATLWASRSRRHIALGVVSLWLLPFLLGERYSDVPVQLPLYAMLAVSVGIGLARLLYSWPGERIVPIAALGLLALALLIPGIRTYPMIQLRSEFVGLLQRELRAMARRVQGNDVVVAEWPADRIAKYELGDRPGLVWVDAGHLYGTEDRLRPRASFAHSRAGNQIRRESG